MTSLPGSGGEVAELDARQQNLNHLISDIHDFLNHWVQRVDGEIRGWGALATPTHVSQMRLDEFEQQKRQWEADCMHEARLIRERSDHLTSAWLQLEAEQRRFLQIAQEHGAPAPGESANSRMPRQTDSLTARGTDTLRRGHKLIGNDSSPKGQAAAAIGTEAIAPPARTRDAAIRQFRQLRQEVSATASSGCSY